MLALRNYQQDLIVQLRQALKRSKCVLVQAPTGAGKTLIASFITKNSNFRGSDVWFLCHRAELIDGTSNTFNKYEINHGIIGSGHKYIDAMAQVCSIQSLKNRLDKLKPPKIAIIDEAHHCGAAGWALIVAWLKQHGSIIIGLSATPIRLDGRGLSDYFDEIVLGPKVSWLIEQGYLSKYRLYAPHAPNMQGIKKSMGEYSITSTAALMDKPKITGDAVSHWRQYADRLKTIAFGVNVEHSMHIASEFEAAGIRARHLDGGTNREERKRIIQAYAAGEIDVLSNVGLFAEGFDMSSIAQTDVTIDCVIDMAPTASLSNYLQRGGRMLRPAEGKIGIYLDHAGNSRHGFFCDDREWSLEGKGKSTKVDDGPPPPVTCLQCYEQVRRPLPPVCACGAPLQAPPESKVIEAGKGVLSELTKEERERRKQEEARVRKDAIYKAKTQRELMDLALIWGYENPSGWAYRIMQSRKGRKTTTGNDNASAANSILQFNF